MNILHIVENYTFKSGGLREAVQNLNKALNHSQDVSSFVLSNICEPGDEVILTEKSYCLWLFTPGYQRFLKGVCAEHKIDVIHIHGVWMHLQYGAAKFAVTSKIPFILSSHGMYEPYYWSNGRFKKLAYFHGISKIYFRQSVIKHAITYLESKNLLRLFPRGNIKTIPNLIEFNTINGVDDQCTLTDFSNKYILSLGRIHPVKGIDVIINALPMIGREDFKLKIAGSFNDYQKELNDLIHSKGLQHRVEFLGMISGKAKEELYRNAFLFISPSKAEAIGIVNLEAARYKTPVITSWHTGLDPEWASNGGMLIEPDKENVAQALKICLDWTVKERNKNGQKLYDHVKKNYSWNTRATDWVYLYKRSIEEEL